MQRNTLKIVSAALAVLISAPAFAQDTAPTTPPAANGLSTGEAVAPAAPQVGQPYVKETFGDWALRCIEAGEGETDPCHLYQLLSDDTDNPVAEISIFPLPAGQEAAAGATIITPLETLLQAGVVIDVDSQGARRYPFAFCGAAGCVSRVALTAEELDQFRRGTAATLTIVPALSTAEDPSVHLQIPLAGFTAAFRAAEAEMPATGN
ncbi:invasion associated locus B family protein [Ketogulonicigenium robustum]|uniref:Invasion associated locus B family protein n=1 Tax=Ketogulonicigenium robustum TaxID=92947 RepID=A0A1W6NYA0_9RHOB|nr:invasion associated locus B family protein [Ketogulonicigenium robustum]ARO14194.1 invasion associated locus B family protein [Ketogulonicigenium robustum]